jgi:hypothetical protein
MARALLVLMLGVAGISAMHGPAAAKDRYWAWGWGLYGVNGQQEALDSARFDWSLLTFGSDDAADRATIDRCNEILKLNPRHRFVIRVWPISNLGDLPENRYQATLFHYLYVDEIRRKVLAQTRAQIEYVLRNIAKPENVAGAVFLEELPSSFTSAPFGPDWEKWKRGDPLPWDIERFRSQIELELGEPFDLTNVKHRRWWGRKYVSVLNEIHREMKSALHGRTVLYYQQTGYPSLDYRVPGRLIEPEADPRLVPIHYRDLVHSGGADGVFGYPNSATIWRLQTQTPVQQLKCLLFSQISLPGGMRQRSLEETTALARWRYPGNLGAFVFAGFGRARGRNEPAYQDDSFWTTTDHVRRFAWDQKINLGIVQRALSPSARVSVVSAGIDRWKVRVAVWNRRDPSWYGGERARAVLRDARVELQVPAHAQLESTSPAAIALGDIEPQDARMAEWRVRGRADTGAVRVIVRSTDAADVRATATLQDTPEVFETQFMRRSGDRWMELRAVQPLSPEVELRPLDTEVTAPALERLGSGERVAYRGSLRPTTRLVIGPGMRARLYATEIFDEATRRFAPYERGSNGAVAFSSGYGVFGTSAHVYSGERYRIRVNGWAADGANGQVVVRFSGTRAGVPAREDVPLIVNPFGSSPSTSEASFVVPYFDHEAVTLTVYFYRLHGRGTVFYESFGCRRVDIPDDGLDVSDRLEGALTARTDPLSVWTYRDASDPNPWARPKMAIRRLQATSDRTVGSHRALSP